MLVLSRKKNESIIIDENICIEVLQIKGKQIRLGITAPNNMKILRGELPPRPEPNSVESVDEPFLPMISNSNDPSQQIVKCNVSALICSGLLTNPTV